MSATSSGPPAPRDLHRQLAHDLGNLAYRLTFLSASLESLMPDAVRRQEAIALLNDTADRLRQAAARLRGEGADA